MKAQVFVFCLFMLACKPDHEIHSQKAEVYDIIVVAGQSNTLNGEGIVASIDSVSEGILQLGRWDEKNFQLIDAIEPLDHHDKRPGKIGFALTFAKLYKDSCLKDGRKVLLIPCGKGSTGFAYNNWNTGNPLYADLVSRVNYVLSKYPGSKLKVFLWHQGESDINNTDFRSQQDAMFIQLRNDLKVWSLPKIIVVGGLVPFWVQQDPLRIAHQKEIKETGKRIPAVAYADPDLPFTIFKKDNLYDAVHYDSAGQRELGKRYFTAYRNLCRQIGKIF